MRVAITGASGRLGRALVDEFRTVGEVRPWSRPGYDLDDAHAASRVMAERPDVVVHSAAWTEVDACAREPLLAMRRNGNAVGELARACATSRCRLVLVSTNEVFSGENQGVAYRADDPVDARNAYGSSKQHGELAALDAFVDQADALMIVRTAWLFGPPGNDFPAKIVAAALRARDSGTPLRLVFDETGSPSATVDVAQGIRWLVVQAASGIHHVVNSGHATRAEWAVAILRAADIAVATELVAASTWHRDSIPPTWGVLESDVQLRSWQEATREYVSSYLRLPART